MKSGKVIVRIQGGLGNQLFCYAAARRLAWANEAELVIDDVTGFVRDVEYRRNYALDRFRIAARKATPHERMAPFERYRGKLARLVARHRPFHSRRYLEQEGVEFDSRLLTYRVKRTVYLDGYWQSEGYFKDAADLVRTDLAIIPPGDAANKEMAHQIKGRNAVAVHVRWFESPTVKEPTHNVAQSYYDKAIKEIAASVSEPHFFVFSDQPDASLRMLRLPREAVTCVSHNRGDENAYADLWLMSQCKHFIIANSTFSWWGAWLSPHKNKIVITPGIVQNEGISYWGFKGLIPQEWTVLSMPIGVPEC
jgi:hypothetical protein